jgi:hypothetical protein
MPHFHRNQFFDGLCCWVVLRIIMIVVLATITNSSSYLVLVLSNLSRVLL